MSQAQLARLARIDPAIVCKIESGRLVPYPGELARIARALKVPPAKAASLLDEMPSAEQKA